LPGDRLAYAAVLFWSVSLAAVAVGTAAQAWADQTMCGHYFDGHEGCKHPSFCVEQVPVLAVFLIGIGMILLGWMLFRRPGVSRRVGLQGVRQFWQANRYLKPPGAALVIAGWVVLLVNLVLSFLGVLGGD
jgi:hypothetical protein